MKLYQPTCWRTFQCAASQCGDNCCIGWEIDIDPDSYARYQALSGPFGDTLRASIQMGETPCFRMKGERCVMLDEENLCQIYRRLGKEGLCQICRDHPLFTDTFGMRRETGLGICCEEAARLLFTAPAPWALDCVDTEEPERPEEVEQPLVERILAIRERLLSLLEETSVPVFLRVSQVLLEAQEAQWLWEEGRWEQLEDVLRAAPTRPDAIPMEVGQIIALLRDWLALFETFEPINDDWTACLEQGNALLEQPEEQLASLWRTFFTELGERREEYARLMGYFIFRYFLKCVYTGDCCTPVRMAAVSTLLIACLDVTRFWKTGQFTWNDRIQLAGLYSKQMEYSEENWAGFEEAMLFDPVMEDTLLQDFLRSL